MTIGLNADQLSTIFNERYREWSRKLEIDRIKSARELMGKGIPERDADIQTMLQVRWEATARANLETFLANNAQIEIDLKAWIKA